MTYDPFQTQMQNPMAPGAYSGVNIPFGTPQPGANINQNPAGVNPFTAISGLLQAGIIPQQLGYQLQTGIPYGYQGGYNPQQSQYGQGFAQQPQLGGGQISPWQHPLQTALLQNPLVAQNPFIGAGLQQPVQAGIPQNPFVTQNPFVNPIAAQLAALSQVSGSQFGGSQFGGSPFGLQQGQYGQAGYPLAPQTWLGQFGPVAGQIGQIHPAVAQLVARSLQQQGFSPWGTL